MSKKLLPGDKLPIEDKLAQQLKVGRGSVREAIKELQSIGVLKIVRGGGTFVTEGDISKALEPLLFSVILSELSNDRIKELRFMFEVSIFENIIPKIDGAQIAKLEENIRSMKAEIDSSPSPDPQRLVELDFDFHCALASMMNNPLAEGLYKVILCLSFPIMKKDYLVDKNQITAVHNHEEICRALYSKDLKLARESVLHSMWHSLAGK